jgi:hypothetical protein
MNINHPDPEFARLERIIVLHVLQGEEIDDGDLGAIAFHPLALASGAAVTSTQEGAFYLLDDLAQRDLLKLSPAASAHCRAQLEEKFERGCRLFARLLAIGQELAVLTHGAGDLARH